MTTFTRIEEGQTPVIKVDVDRRLSAINRNIYGGFLEHMGRCIYGGIYEPGSPLSDAHGYRTDVLEALRELDMPVIRYPGGNFIASYHWQDGIGPREHRPKRLELAWSGIETNQFGTDEFMHWLSTLGGDVEPYLCLNMGTGTLDEAVAWLEYCNGDQDTHWANLRRKNGHEKPYNVKYWALGNEVWGSWQIGQSKLDAYIDKAIQWAKALKRVDPSICLVLCGQRGHMDWDYQVLKACLPYIDMHALHIYTNGKTHMTNVTSPLAAERSIQITGSLIELARIQHRIPADIKTATICFDEWNVWDNFRAPGVDGAEETYTLSDALSVASWLNVFVRQSKYVGMANLAQSVNVISPLMTTPTGVLKQTIWWPLLLFCRHVRGWTLGCHIMCGAYDGQTQPKWLQGVLDTGAPSLDVSASVDERGWVSLVVVNTNEDTDLDTRLDIGVIQGNVEVYTVTGSNVGVINTTDKEEVGVRQSTWDGIGTFRFEKHSMNMLRWDSGTLPASVDGPERKGNMRDFLRSGVDGTFGE